jgi:hypothetical protein
MVSTQGTTTRRGKLTNRLDNGGIPLDRAETLPMAVLPPGTSRCQCNRCGVVFSTVDAFDRHQTLTIDGVVQCWEPSSIGLVSRVVVSKHKKRPVPDQVVWGRPGDPDVTAMFRERRAAA